MVQDWPPAEMRSIVADNWFCRTSIARYSGEVLLIRKAHIDAYLAVPEL
jgi:hypothetical protein